MSGVSETGGPYMKQRDQWHPGEQAVFHYSLAPDPGSDISARLAHRTGELVTVLRAEDPDGNRAAFPTLAERAEEGALLCYAVRFPDGHEDTAFEDELLEAIGFESS